MPNNSVTVYVGLNLVIVAPMHATPSGIFYEQDSPISIDRGSTAGIGASVKHAFATFSLREKNLRDVARSDWPAFQLSGCKTMKQFGVDYHRVFVSFLNESGAIARAEAELPCDTEFRISTSFNPRLSDEEVGKSVLGVVERARRFASL